MNQERMYTILLAPHVSEKSTIVGDEANQVVFRVKRDASKGEIKTAVEQLFDVKVEKVQTAVMKGKEKGFGRIKGRRPNWKKAYVALEAGQDIDFLGGE